MSIDTNRFTPELFIGIGETFAMFTLRETYLHTWYEKPRWGNPVAHHEVRDFHHHNLATTPDEAWAKAVEQAGAMGLPLRGSRDGIERELRDIKRSNAEEMERKHRERTALEEKWAAEREARKIAWANEDADLIAAFRFPFGEHKGKEFCEEIGLANWYVGKRDEFEPDSVMLKIADRILEWPEIVLPRPDPTKHAGTPGKREIFRGVVISVRTIETPNSAWSRYMTITNAVTDDGALLVCFGKFSADVGERFEVKATVKEHGDYKGAAQTIINRAKDIEVKAA
jgi:hypothetical protein